MTHSPGLTRFAATLGDGGDNRFAVKTSGSELKPAGDLDDSVQSSATDRVRLSDLAEGWTIDVEDGVAGSIQAESGRKNAG